MIYLDANASEVPRPQALAAMARAGAACGNPASVHASGRTARAVLEDARETVAAVFGASAAGLVFTSGATEALSLAIHALGHGRRVIVSATEHDAVRAAAAAGERVAVDADGLLDFDAFERALARGPALACVMLANNETGVIQDIARAARLCRAAGALLLVDAVQAAGRMTVDCAALGAHAVALSSHKLGGPLGAGALLLASDARDIAPMIAGGGQERGRRGGTPALPAIAGFAAAVRASATESRAPIAAMRDALERAAVAAGAVVIGAGAPRLDNTTCLALPGSRADTQVMALDLAAICVSAGAACSSGKVARSHVLDAMGLGKLAGEAIRASLPWNARVEDIEAFASAYRDMTLRLRRRQAA